MYSRDEMEEQSEISTNTVGYNPTLAAMLRQLLASEERLRAALTEIEGSPSPGHWCTYHNHCVTVAREALK